MAVKLMLADAESWLHTVLAHRINLHRQGVSDMTINAPALRTRARMARDPGSFRPLRMAEEAAEIPTDVTSTNAGRR